MASRSFEGRLVRFDSTEIYKEVDEGSKSQAEEVQNTEAFSPTSPGDSG
jgi:hypothetical protein